MKQHIKKFIGDRKIVNIVESSLKTWSGKPMVAVKFGDGKIQTYPVAVMEKVVTHKKSDATELQKRRCTPVIRAILRKMSEGYDPYVEDTFPIAKMILEIVAEEDLTVTDDVAYVMQTIEQLANGLGIKVLNAIHESTQNANEAMWGMKLYERTMMDVHRKIKK